MRIERRFSDEKGAPYGGVPFRRADSEIRSLSGETIFEMRDIEVPKSWSQTAVDILAQKYLRKAGVPAKTRRVREKGVPDFLQRSMPDIAALAKLPADKRYGPETSAKQVFDRLAGAWAYWGWKGGYFSEEEDARAYYDEMRHMLARQMAAPNSPQWFNTGLHWAYGIDAAGQGHFYVDHVTGALMESDSAYERPQPHACFIQSVEDSLTGDGGVMDLWKREALLFKYGSGSGTNFSNIRGQDEPLSSGGKSSGLLSFLKVGDAAAGAVKSGGSTRRAAKMVVVDIDHPDIEDFISWKPREEEKVAGLVAGSRALARHLPRVLDACWAGESDETRFDPKKNPALQAAIKEAKNAFIPDASIRRVIDFARQGFRRIDVDTYNLDWDSEAYRTISGQNANNSVRVTDAFLEAVNEDAPWPLLRRTDGKTTKTLRARALWSEICSAAWTCADPGLQFHNTINAWHTCPAGGEIRASNPCSEYMFLDDTACNLASINLLKFKTEHGFDADLFEHASRLWTLTLEISVMMAQYPSEAIARRSYDYRTLGLGFANLGGLLMSSGFAYDSEEGRAVAAGVSALMTGSAYRASAEIASAVGPFAKYEENRDAMLRVGPASAPGLAPGAAGCAAAGSSRERGAGVSLRTGLEREGIDTRAAAARGDAASLASGRSGTSGGAASSALGGSSPACRCSAPIRFAASCSVDSARFKRLRVSINRTKRTMIARNATSPVTPIPSILARFYQPAEGLIGPTARRGGGCASLCCHLPIREQGFQILFQYFPIGIARQRFSDEANRDRHLEGREARAHPILQFGLGRGHAGGEVNHRRRLLSERAVRDTDDRAVGHRGMLIESIFHL